MIKAAIFDVFGTVVDWRSGVSAVLERAFAAKGIDADPVAFAVAWRGEYQPAMERIRAAERRYVSLDDLHFENLHRVLAYFEIADRFTEAEMWDLNAAWEQLPPWPDSVEGLSRIKARMIIAPCSNGSIALMARLARFAGLPWDCILGADVARAYKPDPLAYRMSVAALRLAQDEVVMVAAHNDDLAAARAEGLRTAFLPRPTEHGSDQSTDLEPAADWDFAVDDLNALARALPRTD